MAKIEPLRPHFENMRALLARIAEDEDAVGFVGCILRKNGTLVPVSFDVTRDQMSFAAAIWLRDCLDVE